MRAAKNTIYASDVTSLPIKVKYTSSYYDNTIAGNGITINKGINKPIYSYIKPDQETLIYRFAKHSYYSNFLTGSFPVSASSYDNWMQSTAVSSSKECDYRYFPTGANEEITVIAIPRTKFGEKVSPITFALVNSGSYNIYDDGNGNIRDYGTGSQAEQLNTLYNTSLPDFATAIAESTQSIHVGNIIYAHGIVVLTNQDYQDIFGI
jgi:hypothetical protein